MENWTVAQKQLTNTVLKDHCVKFNSFIYSKLVEAEPTAHKYIITSVRYRNNQSNLVFQNIGDIQYIEQGSCA